jgi:predicted dehydrogenase
VLERAGRAGLVNAVCFNIRFYPMCHQARAHVANGDIGEPRLVTGSYLQDWLLLDTDWNWRLQPEQAGELRAVADIGSHWLDLVRFITGRRVESVFAELHTFVKVREHPTGPVETFAAAGTGTGSDRGDLVREEMSSDDAASILLRMEGGTRAVMAVSQVSAGHKNAVTVNVDGSTDAIRWSSTAPDELWLGHRGRPNEVAFRDPGLADPSASALMAYPPGHVEGFPDTFRALFSQVYADVLRGGPSDEPTYPTFADGLDAVRVTEAVARSSREGRWVPVERGADAST